MNSMRPQDGQQDSQSARFEGMLATTTGERSDDPMVTTVASLSESAPPSPYATRRSVARELLARRKIPLILMMGTLAAGITYMLVWNVTVRHSNSWAVGDDLWGIVRGAHYVGWGYIGGIYTPANGINSFPGMSVLLSPVTMLVGMLHMTESVAPIYLARPTAALILQPVELLLGSTVIFAVDALAERLDVERKRRFALCVIVAVIAWPASAVWGHAEDMLAMTFALYGLVAALDAKWKKCGWLLGFGICFQPLVAMMLPVLIGAAPAGRRLLLAIRSFALSAMLVGIAAAGNAADTYRALVTQPTAPWVNHPTPWVWLAPRVATSRAIQQSPLKIWGHLVPGAIPAANSGVLVAGGAGRAIGVVLAASAGIYVWCRAPGTVRLVWIAALVLGMRCLFEAVMTPYYLAPPLILGLIVVSLRDGKRFWSASALALGVTVFSYSRLGPWVWWLPVLVAMAAVLALGRPARGGSRSKRPSGLSDSEPDLHTSRAATAGEAVRELVRPHS